jgi:predicted enzyme related to lactoylglutathione lyase
VACRFTELNIDCHDPAPLVQFWSEVLDYRVSEAAEDGSWIAISGGEGAGPALVFARVPDVKIVKNRLHMDLSPRDRDQDEEVERIIALGARRIDIGQGEQTWVVLADPAGNEFCVLRTRRPD